MSKQPNGLSASRALEAKVAKLETEIERARGEIERLGDVQEKLKLVLWRVVANYNTHAHINGGPPRMPMTADVMGGLFE